MHKGGPGMYFALVRLECTHCCFCLSHLILARACWLMLATCVAAGGERVSWRLGGHTMRRRAAMRHPHAPPACATPHAPPGMRHPHAPPACATRARRAGTWRSWRWARASTRTWSACCTPSSATCAPSPERSRSRSGMRPPLGVKPAGVPRCARCGIAHAGAAPGCARTRHPCSAWLI